MTTHKSVRLYTLSILLALAFPAFAQNFDASGNGTLNGTYFVRELLFSGASGISVPSAISVIGTITFDGKGAYTFNGRQSNHSSGATNAALSLNGTYEVSSSGFAIIQSLADPADSEYGGVAGTPGPHAFTASATEKGNLSVMVGIPAGSSSSNSSLNGAWSAGSIDFTNADPGFVRNASFSFNPDGAGNIGAISVNGMAANLGNTATTQTVSGVTYSLSANGSGTVNFGASSPGQLISGAKNLYLSSDGNILLGGAPDGFDLFVAIRSLGSGGSNASANGIYYPAGLLFSSTATLGNVLTGFNGSINSNGSGLFTSHNRLKSSIGPVFDSTLGGAFTVAANGTFQLPENLAQFTLGDGGQAFIATGAQGVYYFAVGFQTQQFSGSGVYLNPLGIVNAGSFAPATNPIAPGEIIAIFGSGLSNSNATAKTLPLPANLGGVTVTINGVQAPLFYVSPTQITAMVPYSISTSNGANYATFNVANNGTNSNSVTMYVRNSSPGVFSLAESGIGQAAAEHADYSVISNNNPAHPGETITIYLGGLGAVSPPVQEGNAAPSSPLSQATGGALVTFSEQGVTTGTLAPAFAGLTPTLAGLYQVNIVVPNSLAPGDALVNVVTNEGSTSGATIHVGP